MMKEIVVMTRLILDILIDGNKISKLRLLVKLGRHGRAHQYKDHFLLHCTDMTYSERVDFYREHGMEGK